MGAVGSGPHTRRTHHGAAVIRRPDDLRRGIVVWMWWCGRWAHARVESVHVLEQAPRRGRDRGDYAKVSLETVIHTNIGRKHRILSGKPRTAKRYLVELIPIGMHEGQPDPADTRGEAEGTARNFWGRVGVLRGGASAG